MNTRLSIDLKDPQLMTLLQYESVHSQRSVREIIAEALSQYFSNKKENAALLKLAHRAFEEWDNPEDSQYDKF